MHRAGKVCQGRGKKKPLAFSFLPFFPSWYMSLPIFQGGMYSLLNSPGLAPPPARQKSPAPKDFFSLSTTVPRQERLNLSGKERWGQNDIILLGCFAGTW